MPSTAPLTPRQQDMKRATDMLWSGDVPHLHCVEQSTGTGDCDDDDKVCIVNKVSAPCGRCPLYLPYILSKQEHGR